MSLAFSRYLSVVDETNGTVALEEQQLPKPKGLLKGQRSGKPISGDSY
jgi:hypothetical protein